MLTFTGCSVRVNIP